MVSVGVQTDVLPAVCGKFAVDQTEALVDKRQASTEQRPSNHPVPDSRFKTINMEPTWTSENPNAHPVQRGKCCKTQVGRCVSIPPHHQSTLGPVGMAGIARLSIVSEMGRMKWYQNEIPDYSSKELATDSNYAHHNHTTASHRVVNKTLAMSYC